MYLPSNSTLMRGINKIYPVATMPGLKKIVWIKSEAGESVCETLLQSTSLKLCLGSQRLRDNYQRLEFQPALPHMIREAEQWWKIKAETLNNESPTKLIRSSLTLQIPIFCVCFEKPFTYAETHMICHFVFTQLIHLNVHQLFSTSKLV